MNSNVIAIKNRYKNAVETKYTGTIAALPDETLELVVERIDAMIEEKAGNDDTITALLLILREISVNQLSQ